MGVSSEVTAEIISMTNQQMYANIETVYKEILRQLVNTFGGLYVNDEHGNKTKVACVTGQQERLKGKANKANTLVLPYITVNDISTSNNDSRRRYNPILVHEKEWDVKTMRAKRVLSLPPRPIDLTYQINLWTKYKEDMDVLRYSIFSLFNPDLEIKTKFSDFTKAFIESDREIGTSQANDREDRKLKRTITILVETYMPSPKFLYTNTGEIECFIYDFDVVTDPY